MDGGTCRDQATFQLFGALPEHVEAALLASIERFGVLVPVAIDQHGNVLDGHHRQRIAKKLGISVRYDTINVRDEDEARAIAQTLNADRRQLTEEQRREVVKALREQGHSYRAIGGALGVSHTQARQDFESAQLESGFQSPEPDRVNRLGGGSYPARRPTVVTARNARESA